MSKRKVSQSEAIREVLRKNPVASTVEVINAVLDSIGERVSPNLIYQIKHEEKKRQEQDAFLARLNLSDEPILLVRSFAKQVGGLDNLLRLVLTLKKLDEEKEVKP